jgi:hypothetical protein
MVGRMEVMVGQGQLEDKDQQHRGNNMECMVMNYHHMDTVGVVVELALAKAKVD